MTLRKGGVYRLNLDDGSHEHVLAVAPIPDDPHGLWHGRRVDVVVEVESVLVFNEAAACEIGGAMTEIRADLAACFVCRGWGTERSPCLKCNMVLCQACAEGSEILGYVCCCDVPADVRAKHERDNRFGKKRS